MKLTPLAKLVLVLAILVTAFFSVKRFAPDLLEKIVPSAKPKDAQVPPRADLPTGEPSTSGYQAGPVSAPAAAGCTDKPEVRFLVWAWNAQSGGMLANGGPQSTAGSLMCQNGVNLRYIREDMVDKMQEQLVAFATGLSKGERNPSSGAHFVAIMGDGSATFLKGLNDTLRKLGPGYTAKVVGSMGYSRGEDKFMGPPSWKENPQASRGGVVAGYLRDGDWNIAMKWLGDNQICNNPDEKTYDPGCLNWVAANDYLDAGEKYITGYCEDRPIVRKGKRTGETFKACVNGVVTWTPGDVNVAQKKGGLTSIVSTAEYSSQMPNTIIGIDKWMKENRGTVEGMLSAIFQAGDQIKSDPSALRRSAEISAQVYKEADAAYWEKYFKGVVERDKQGLMVELGGSSVNNLADNQILFGMRPGAQNLFAATYTVFGEIVKQQYPELVPSIDPVKDILDTSYIEGLARRSDAPRTEAEMPKFETSAKELDRVVSRRNWQITFDSGKATFSGGASRDLELLLKDLLVAGATTVEIHGHTDAAGTADGNLRLSEARAFAVKRWLEEKAPVNFPEGRLRIFSHGQTQPLAENSTPEGMAKNRRVEIVMGTVK